MLVNIFRLILKTFFREITLEGIESLPSEGAVIFAPNHPNALVDPLLLFMLPKDYRIRFVAKAPLFNIPLLGWLMRKMGAIPVIRRRDVRGRVDYRTFFQTCLDSLAAGESIVIFPEGISLPQPHMAELRTGIARLFFLSQEQGQKVSIVPVGINYEYGSIFRSPVMVSFGKPLATTNYIAQHQQDPKVGVRGLTHALENKLENLVFQADNHRDRQLMLLLERIIFQPPEYGGTWPQRLSHLKSFSSALKILRDSHPEKIEKLRQLLTKYQEGTTVLQAMGQPAVKEIPGPLWDGLLKALCGLPLAALGWVLNVIPYQLCRLIVTHIKKYDEAAAATYKIVYSVLLFPLSFLIEGMIIHHYLGGGYTLLFALTILPLSYFTLFYMEWLSTQNWRLSMWGLKLPKKITQRLLMNLEIQRGQIHSLVNELYDYFEASSIHQAKSTDS